MNIAKTIIWLGVLLHQVVYGCDPVTKILIEAFDVGAYRHLTVAQRMLIADTIQSYDQCKMLVSNTGLDSGLWMSINKRGQTYFMEHDQFWIDQCMQRFPGINIVKVEYYTTFSEWQHLLDTADSYANLPRGVADLMTFDYDVIFIDGPESHPKMATTVELIGRMQAFFLAHELFFNSAKTVHLFIHDTDRDMERTATDKLFGSYLVKEVGNLRYYING
jgi:hypothetical protein